MTYSRWLDSDWYIFWWSTASGTTLETQLLVVDRRISAAAGRQVGTLTLAEVEALLKLDAWERWPDTPTEQMDYVKDCFRRWLLDMRRDFPASATRRKCAK